MSGYLNSSIFSDSKGIITTISNPQKFDMVDINKPRRYTVASIIIKADPTSPHPVEIKLNDENSIIYIEAGETWKFDGSGLNQFQPFLISNITCVSPVGSKFSFEAGASITTCYV